MHLGKCGHGADRAFLGGDQIGGRIGKAQHTAKAVFAAIVETVCEDVVQHAGAEGVARAGGFDRAAEQKCGHIDAQIAVIAVAAVRTGGDVQKPDVGKPAAKDRRALVKIGLTG